MTPITEFVEKTLRAAIEAHQQGRLDDADRGYTEILTQVPNHADALHLSGLVAFQRGLLEDAKNLVESAIDTDASVSLYHANLGRICMAQADFQGALNAWQVALVLSSDAVDIHSDIAGALLELDRPDEALLTADMALELNPNHPLALLNRGLALMQLSRFSEATKALERSAVLLPDNSDIWFRLGQSAQQATQMELAELAYRNTLQLDPKHLETHNNLGNLMRDLMRFDEAIYIYRQALVLYPMHSDLHSNLGVALQERGDVEDAIACYREAIKCEPSNAEAHRNLGMGLLQQGQFREGWDAYEWRWRTRHFAPIVRDWKAPRWQGEQAREQVLLVHCEQGFGDCLQFARYLSLAAGKVGRIIVEAPDSLVALFARIEGVDEVFVAGGKLPNFDLHIPLLSMPHVFETTLETIPNHVPYLQVDPEKFKRWREHLSKKLNEKLVGIVWSGSGIHQRNLMRSPGFSALSPLLRLNENVRFISLQKDHGLIREEGVVGSERIEDHTSELKSFDDTAALISQLDAVVAPDTAVAHLSGALGIPTYLALTKNAEWRWLHEREDSPWYPNFVLVRQQEQGDWSTVFEFIAREL